jgi:acyl-CoA dehydrogenase
MIFARESPFWGEEHRAFRDSVRRFVEREISPFAAAWDEAEGFPRELYRKAGEAGLLGLGFAEDYGGLPGDRFLRLILGQEIARAGSGGVAASLFSHTIGAPPIALAGSVALKSRVLPRILAGELISALAVTEPGGGSDVANLTTTARRDGDVYVLNGEKTFITSGMRADVITVAARTGGPGAGGVSMIVVEGHPDGLTRTELKKMGWWASDTATLTFDNVRVPADNLLGGEGQGFAIAMMNFNDERLALAASSNAFAAVCHDEALDWARQRKTFGKRIADHQVIRHKLADMAQRILATQANLEMLALRLDRGEHPVGDICLLKNQATQTLAFCASEGVQILGGAGYMRGTKCERIYREVKVNAIGGGTEEIMKDLASRQFGY